MRRKWIQREHKWKEIFAIIKLQKRIVCCYELAPVLCFCCGKLDMRVFKLFLFFFWMNVFIYLYFLSFSISFLWLRICSIRVEYTTRCYFPISSNCVEFASAMPGKGGSEREMKAQRRMFIQRPISPSSIFKLDCPCLDLHLLHCFCITWYYTSPSSLIVPILIRFGFAFLRYCHGNLIVLLRLFHFWAFFSDLFHSKSHNWISSFNISLNYLSWQRMPRVLFSEMLLSRSASCFS